MCAASRPQQPLIPTARLAQSAGREVLNLVVVGSSPTVGGYNDFLPELRPESEQRAEPELNLGAPWLRRKDAWRSGITPAQHAGGPGFNPQCFQHIRSLTSTRATLLRNQTDAATVARCQDSLAEWSKALAQGASPQGRGFEPHSCHWVRRSFVCAGPVLQRRRCTMTGHMV